MKNNILLYIELPPPMHGMTYINKIIYDNLKVKDEYVFYNTNFTSHTEEVSKISLSKVFKNISIMFGAWGAFFKCRPIRVYSLLSASKFGIIRDFMINLPAILFRKELILHLHGFTYYKIYQTSKLYKVLFDLMTENSKIIVLCEKQKSETLSIVKRDSLVLHNTLRYDAKVKPREKNEVLQICYISNISKDKGIFDLVKAIQDSKLNVKLIVAGNFLSDKDEFLELIRDCESISYVGFADENIKKEILESSDIFCLPSKLEEGSPISIIEAMSYGLPVIASDKGCIKEMIDDVGYLLLEKYLYDDIIQGLEFIDNNYEKLSSNSLIKYKHNYTKNKFINKLENILKEGL